MKKKQNWSQKKLLLNEWSFNFDWPRYVDENLKYEIKFIIKRNESLAEKKRGCAILLKYKHGNNIYEHGKQ